MFQEGVWRAAGRVGQEKYGWEFIFVAANIDASHEAEVRLSVSERLEAITSTSAKLYYKGEPAILRKKNSLFGGEITSVSE